MEQLDVAFPASVNDFADRWDASGRPLHVLVNNAGILNFTGCASRSPMTLQLLGL